MIGGLKRGQGELLDFVQSLLLLLNADLARLVETHALSEDLVLIYKSLVREKITFCNNSFEAVAIHFPSKGGEFCDTLKA